MSEYGLSPRVIEYPSSDGKPMTESEAQFIPMHYVAGALRTHFRERDDVYVGTNMFLYYERGNPAAVISPDVFVVIGAPKYVRDSYMLWNEPKGPDFVLEITSRSTRAEDQGRKKYIYESLGVGEYFLFDPTGDYLRPQLQGFALRGGIYQPMSTVLSDGERGLFSQSTGLGLLVRNDELRLHDPVTGRDLVSLTEAVQGQEREAAARKAAEARADNEAAARKAAEARADNEAAARKAAEAHVAELEALLRQRREE